MCMYICITHQLVCLFDKVNQSVTTTMGSGLHGPQGPFSTSIGRLEPYFYKVGIVKEYNERLYIKVGELIEEGDIFLVVVIHWLPIRVSKYTLKHRGE